MVSAFIRASPYSLKNRHSSGPDTSLLSTSRILDSASTSNGESRDTSQGLFGCSRQTPQIIAWPPKLLVKLLNPVFESLLYTMDGFFSSIVLDFTKRSLPPNGVAYKRKQSLTITRSNCYFHFFVNHNPPVFMVIRETYRRRICIT